MRGRRPAPIVPVMPTPRSDDSGGVEKRREVRPDGGTRTELYEQVSEAPLVPDCS